MEPNRGVEVGKPKQEKAPPKAESILGSAGSFFIGVVKARGNMLPPDRRSMDRQVVRGGFAGRSEKRNGGGHVGRVPADDRRISDTDLMDAIIIEASGAGFDVDIPDPASAARMRDSLEEWDNQGGAVEKPLCRETQGRSGDDADGGGGQKRPRTGMNCSSEGQASRSAVRQRAFCEFQVRLARRYVDDFVQSAPEGREKRAESTSGRRRRLGRVVASLTQNTFSDLSNETIPTITTTI